MKNSEFNKFHGFLEGFKSFKSRHNLTDKKIIQIMTEYANTEDEYSASFFAEKYDITLYEFYRLKDYTIILMLVDAPVCKRIRDKSFRNQSKKNASGNYSSASHHYKELIGKRKEYLKSFSDEEIGLIAVEYANGDAIYDIAKKHNISTYTVRKLLAIALANHLVCESVYQSIRIRSQNYIIQLNTFCGYTAEQLWNNYSHWE